MGGGGNALKARERGWADNGGGDCLLGGLLFVAGPLFEEDLFEGFFAGGFLEFGFRGYRAVCLVEGDLFYGLDGLGSLGGFGEVA